MKHFENIFGDIVSDEKNYYVCLSNSADDFTTIGDPADFYTEFNRARSYAKKQSLQYPAVDLCCERWIDDPDYCAPVTIWRERYENGKKQWRMKTI